MTASLIKAENTGRELVLRGKEGNMFNVGHGEFKGPVISRLLNMWFLNWRVVASDLDLGVISISMVFEIIV